MPECVSSGQLLSQDAQGSVSFDAHTVASVPLSRPASTLSGLPSGLDNDDAVSVLGASVLCRCPRVLVDSCPSREYVQAYAAAYFGREIAIRSKHCGSLTAASIGRSSHLHGPNHASSGHRELANGTSASRSNRRCTLSMCLVPISSNLLRA